MTKRYRTNLTASTVGALVALLFAANAFAAVLPSGVEQKCLSKLGKMATKLAGTTAKELSRCRAADVSGDVVGACPNAGNTTKIAAIAAKVVGAAASSCKSVCSVSQEVECVADGLCPPLIDGVNQQCSAGAKNLPFDMRRIGFPGPYCEAIVGGPILSPQDIGECTRTLAEQAAGDLIDNIYGSLTNASNISAGAASCLAAVSKAAQKLTKATAKGVGKCRDSINKGKTLGDPKNCAVSDPKASVKIASAAQKLSDVVAASCPPGVLSEIDICGAGVGGIASVAAAQTCLVDAAKEIGDSAEVPAIRLYAPVSIIESAYPPAATCGNGVVDQLPNKYLLLGEECDGADDSECPGQCLPPGDLFECTCGDRPRLRAFADGPSTDADAGWTGNSHDQQVTDLSGYVIDLSNCDCDQFTDATCTGTSIDPICDQDGIQTPFCSWDTTQSVRCDTVGNNDNKDRDEDCRICDDFSVNAGTVCSDSTDCQSQCYDAGGVATGPCNVQGDCASGEVCRGQCDDTQRCIITPNGAPFPVVTAGAGVCNVQTFREQVTGTRNIITGENETYFKLFSVTHLGESTSRPCPVCGGFCVGGTNNLSVCEGRCESSEDPCRFDSDCPGLGEKCSEQTPDCPGGSCELELICGTDPAGNSQTYGNPCRIDYEHTDFGTISNDCLPAPGLNINGEGFRINHTPTGSELKVLPFTLPCTAAGFGLFDCPCPDDGGHPTKPNGCNPACDAGAELGTGCADGNGSGQGTTCAAGVNAGKLCDEDSDCPGSSCSDNPTHCVGDPAFERFNCTTNGDCGLGTCVDACPSGRCVPLCLPQIADPEEGTCAAGPAIYSCSGVGHTYITCTQAAAENTCAATCSVTPMACDSIDDCPPGETCQGSCENSRDCEAGADGSLGTLDDKVGAGNCVMHDRECNLNPIAIEGGDTLNGKGDATNYLRASVYCFGRTTNAGINAPAGFGGPGTIRERGVNVMNVDSIP